MPRYPSARKIKRKKKKGLYYNPSNNEFETVDQVSRNLYNSPTSPNPDVIIDGKEMSNAQHLAEHGTGAIVNSYEKKGPFKNKKSKVRSK